MAKESVQYLNVRKDPLWPTSMKRRTRDGRIEGVGSGVWLYKKVPLSPTFDAKTVAQELKASLPLSRAFDAIAGMAKIRGTRRSMVRGSYREFHLLFVNVPRWFEPPLDYPARLELVKEFREATVNERVLLLGIPLRDSIKGDRSIREAVDGVVSTFVSGGIDMSAYDDDFYAVDAALSDAGLISATDDEIRLAHAYFNHGGHPDPVMFPDSDCIAIVRDAAGVRAIQRDLMNIPIAEWPSKGYSHHALAFASVERLDLDYIQVTHPAASWAYQLVGAGALAISMRGFVEPAKITRREVEEQQKRYIQDIRDRRAANRLSRADQEQELADLESINALYATGGGAPTLVDTSILVAFQGARPDVESILGNDSPVVLNPMVNRQKEALGETWLASPIRANPHRLDLPSTTVAYSGIVSMSQVGDSPSPHSVLIGMTEMDRQPAWWNPRAAYEESEVAPLWLLAGASGSGKTALLQWIAYQLARTNTPTVFIDPKQNSMLDPVVHAAGGTVVSLDDLVSSDGVFDPLRTAISTAVGVDMAAGVLMSVNPWGPMRSTFETPLNVALAYGVAHGATCIGQALRIARDQNGAPVDMVDAVLNLANANPLFRAMVGLNPDSSALRVSDGLTYIRVGKNSLQLPDPGTPIQDMDQSRRINVTLVRQMVLGSAAALNGRNGVVMFDEAWTFLGSGNSELERLGRVARSQTVTVVMATQRVSDATTTGLDDYIAGGWILSLKEKEAVAACRMLDLEPDTARINRITSEPTIGGTGGNLQPNYSSFKALRDPDTGRVVRGSVAIYADLHNRAVPTEIVIPPDVLRLASTNSRDIAARNAGERPTQ